MTVSIRDEGGRSEEYSMTDAYKSKTIAEATETMNEGTRTVMYTCTPYAEKSGV